MLARPLRLLIATAATQRAGSQTASSSLRQLAFAAAGGSRAPVPWAIAAAVRLIATARSRGPCALCFCEVQGCNFSPGWPRLEYLRWQARGWNSILVGLEQAAQCQPQLTRLFPLTTSACSALPAGAGAYLLQRVTISSSTYACLQSHSSYTSVSQLLQ